MSCPDSPIINANSIRASDLPANVAANVQMGPLEQEIMDIVWCRGPISVRLVHERISLHRHIAYTTVMTVMARLVEKKYLQRKKQGKAHVYEAMLSRENSARCAVQHFFENLFSCYQADGLAAFADEFAKLDHAQQEKIREIVSKRPQKS